MKPVPFENTNEYVNTEVENKNTSGYWNEKKEKLKKLYSNVTEEDVTFYVGKEKEMVEMLGYKLSMTLDEMCAVIDTL